jgi:predicted RNA binding protein YcfA (HicA-like mRNA interferase family)
MSGFPAAKARRVLAALERIGWQIKRQSGSHKTLMREGWPDFVFAFHEGGGDWSAHVGADQQSNRPSA